MLTQRSGERRLRAAVVVLLGFAVSSAPVNPAGAFEHSLTLAIDTDNRSASGCDWIGEKASGAPVATGIETLLLVKVDASSAPLQVSAVELRACEGSTFAAASPLAAGGWPVGAGTGVAGADVVEFSVPIPLLGAGPTLRLFASTRSAAGGHDLLLTSDGTPSGAAILFGVGAALPALDWPGWFLMALVFLASGFSLLRWRRARTLVLAACVLVALRSASALVLGLDGQVGEWTSASAVAQDISGDTAGGGGVHSDLVALFAALDADTLALRIDVAGIPRPLDYAEFAHVTDAAALEAALAAGTNTWLYLDHDPRDYFIDNPVAINLDGKHWAIHGGSMASTSIRPLNPDDDLFVISGSGSISFTGMRIGTYPSTSIDKKCLHFLDDGVKRIEANQVSQVGCSVLIESPGEAVFQGYQVTPRSDLGVLKVNVHEAFVVDHPLADVSFLSVETTTNNIVLATEIDCGVDGTACARFHQKQGRLRVLNGSLQAHYGRAFFRFDSTSALGPHVIAASRSEGANAYQSSLNRPHTIAYVPPGATADLALLAVSESQNSGVAGCSIVDWNGSDGRLWLAGVVNDCAGAALVSGAATGGRIQAILNANDDQGDGYFSVTGAQVFTAHNIVGEHGSRGWLDVDARMADWSEAWDLPPLDWPDSLKRPVVSAPLPEMVNVATYGATPDDGEDDAQAFQDALDDHCDPGGKPIMLYCPDGEYNIDSRSLAYGHTQFGSACAKRPAGGWFAGRSCRLVRKSSAKDAVFRYGSHSAFFQGWHFVTRPFDETELDPINEPAFSSEHLGSYAPQQVVFQDVVFDGGVAGACMGCVIDGNNSEFIAVRSTFRNAGCGWCSGNPNALNNMPIDSLFEDNMVHMGELPLYDEQLGAKLSNGGGKVNGSLRATLKRSRGYDLSGHPRYAFYHHGLVSDGARITGSGIGWTSGVSVRLYDQAVFSGLEAASLLQDAPVGGDIFIDSKLNHFDPTLRDNTLAVLAVRSETPEAYRASIVDEGFLVDPSNGSFPRVEHVPAYLPPTPHASVGIRMGQHQVAPGQSATATLLIQGDAVGDVQVWIDCDDGVGETSHGSYTPDAAGMISIPAGCTPIEAGAYRVQVRVEREGVEDRDVQLLRVEPAGKQSLALTVAPAQGTAGSYLGSEVSATLINDPTGAFDSLYYCRKSCDGGEKNLELCADNSDCVGSTTSGNCRAQGTCRGGLDDGLACHFDTDCRRDTTTLHHFCEPDDWEFRAVGSTWATDASICDDLYNASPGTYTPQLQVRYPSVQDGMKDILNVRIVDSADGVPITID